MNKLFNILRNRLKKNPKAFYILFYAEMCELIGRFGISSLLVLYVTHDYHMKDAQAFALFGCFMALIFVTPIIGGYIADRYLGHRQSAILGALIMSVGDAFLIMHHETMLYMGLTIIAVGYGFLIPTLSALLGQVYDKRENERDKGFTLYYISKNIGALIAPAACGIIAHIYDYNYAFILTTLSMLTGAVVLIVGYKHLPNSAEQFCSVKKTASIPISIISIALLIPLVHYILTHNLDGYMLIIAAVSICAYLFFVGIKESSKVRKHLLAIVIFTGIAIVFSAFLGLGSTALNLFIDRIVDRHVFGILIPTPMLFSLDPLFMIVLGPFLAAYFLKLARNKKPVSATGKTSIGMLLFAVGFAVFVVASQIAAKTGTTSMLFIVLAYAIFPLAELCIMPITLSMVTRLAPRNLQAMLVAVYMLGLSIASYLTGKISTIGQVTYTINSEVTRKSAALIYHHLFLITTIVLAITVIVLFLLRYFMCFLEGKGKDTVPVESNEITGTALN